MRRTSLLVLTAVLVAALTACSPGGAPVDPGVVPLGSATPSPTATQERETGLVRPATVFGADCGSVFSEAELSSALGLTMTFNTAAGFDPGLAVERVGGIECNWSGPTTGTSYYVTVVVVPSAAVSYTVPTGCGDLYDSTGCVLESDVNGIRLSGAILDGYASGAHSTPAMQSSLLTTFEAHATEAMSAPVPLPAAGSWDTTPDCAAVVSLGDFSAVPGLGTGTTGEEWGGFDGYFPAAMSALWSQFSPTGCGLIGSAAEVGFYAYGGGRWQGAQVAADAGAIALAVDGLDEVWVTETDSRYYINVLDGPNWLNFDVAHVSNAAAIAQQLVAALDATAIP